jgi:hypothetical protein
MILSNNNEPLEISICEKILSKYKNNDKNYEDFCINYLKKILYNVEIIHSKNQNYEEYNVDINLLSLSLENDNVLNHFKNIFTKERIFKDDYIVLITKTRDYNLSEFQIFKENFFKKINEIGYKVVLLGEREVEDTIEYSMVGRDYIYSNYEDFIKNVDKNLIEDLTIPRLGVTIPNIEQIFKDMSIIYNSYKTIMIGRGGFFCTSIFSKKLHSLNYSHHVDNFKNQINKQIFTNYQEFINKIK